MFFESVWHLRQNFIIELPLHTIDSVTTYNRETNFIHSISLFTLLFHCNSIPHTRPFIWTDLYGAQITHSSPWLVCGWALTPSPPMAYLTGRLVIGATSCCQKKEKLQFHFPPTNSFCLTLVSFSVQQTEQFPISVRLQHIHTYIHIIGIWRIYRASAKVFGIWPDTWCVYITVILARCCWECATGRYPLNIYNMQCTESNSYTTQLS